MNPTPSAEASESRTTENKENTEMIYQSGQKPGQGTYMCRVCGYLITIETEEQTLPACPICDARVYKKLDSAPE